MGHGLAQTSGFLTPPEKRAMRQTINFVEFYFLKLARRENESFQRKNKDEVQQFFFLKTCKEESIVSDYKR